MARIAVMGSGGLGGYFGALLTRGGSDVSFVARGAHLAAMRSHGLRVDPDVVHIDPVQVTDDPGDIGPVDVVLGCVKLWDTQDALAAMRPLIGPHTAMGVIPERGVEGGPVRRGVRCRSGHRRGGLRRDDGLRSGCDHEDRPPGAAGVRRAGRFDLGACAGSARRVPAGGIAAEVSTDISSEIWKKFVFLVGLSATTTRMRLPIGPIRAHPQTRSFLLDVMREVVAVGRARRAVADILAIRATQADHRRTET